MFKKGYTPWNKGVTGYIGANKTSFKKRKCACKCKACWINFAKKQL